MVGLTSPRVVAIVLATLITLPLAASLYQVPIQVSDSLEPIVIATTAASVGQLMTDAPRFSPTTLRPMRYVQARWLLKTAEATGLGYRAVFRSLHVALLMLLVALFVIAVRVRTWTDLAAFTIAFPVLIGIHTFAAMLFEAFPVNHYAEVGVCALGILVLAQQPPRWYIPAIACVLLVFALSVVESGALVWIVVVGCAAARMRGITRSTVIATTLLIVGYFLVRHSLGIASPGIGGMGSGFGATFYSADALKARFGEHPLGFMAYNVASGLLSLLLSEPRTGVYGTAIWWKTGTLHPVLAVNFVSSAITTAVIGWYAVRRLRVARAAWSDADRAFAVCWLVILVNAVLTAAYIKDEIISVGGLFYAVAAFIALRELLASMPARSLAASAAMTLTLMLTAGLWTFRDLGVHYQLRYDAFKLRNDWAEVLRPDTRQDWPRDPAVLALTRRIRDEAIAVRTASPSFMPRWGDRWWVE
ncbi:MAG TPA: hypothetical protein VGJ78_04805 [Vicinamibacterales bacterium]